MLSNNFYHIAEMRTEDNGIKATITFNRAHSIFEGHFPGNPVVPGVCMILIIRELLEQSENINAGLFNGDNIKFLQMINPDVVARVDADIHFTREDNSYIIDASLFLDQVTYFKFKGSFLIV